MKNRYFCSGREGVLGSLPTPERKKRITNPIKNKTADAP
jgi:hypothetical protein